MSQISVEVGASGDFMAESEPLGSMDSVPATRSYSFGTTTSKPKGIMTWSATPSKTRFLQPGQLARVKSGEDFDFEFIDATLVDGQCPFSTVKMLCCALHWRSRHLVHVVTFSAGLLILLGSLAVSRGTVIADAAMSPQIELRSPRLASTASASLLSDSRLVHGRVPLRMLTVCTGNTCRSAMMLVLFKLELQRLGLKNVIVESAGTGFRAGLHRPASPHSLTLFPELLKEHRSTRINEIALSVFDLIFCMTNEHKEAVLEQCVAERINASRTTPGEGGGGGGGGGGGSSSSSSAKASEQMQLVKLHGDLENGHGGEEVARKEEMKGCEVKVHVYPGGLDDPFNKTLVCACVICIREGQMLSVFCSLFLSHTHISPNCRFLQSFFTVTLLHDQIDVSMCVCECACLYDWVWGRVGVLNHYLW